MFFTKSKTNNKNQTKSTEYQKSEYQGFFKGICTYFTNYICDLSKITLSFYISVIELYINQYKQNIQESNKNQTKTSKTL